MSSIRSYRRPSDLPLRMPVFPLRGAILLPRATLPLNVFEPRYLALVDHVMSTNRILGIVQPAGHAPDNESPGSQESPEGDSVQLQSVGCVGRITSYQEMDDGRYVITLTGIARFESLAEVETDDPFRTVAVTYDRFIEDFEEGYGEQDVDREHLLQVLKSYLELNKMEADWPSIIRASSELLINALSMMSPYGPEEKQALLEATDLKSRADVLIALAEMELASGGSRGGTLQ